MQNHSTNQNKPLNIHILKKFRRLVEKKHVLSTSGKSKEGKVLNLRGNEFLRIATTVKKASVLDDTTHTSMGGRPIKGFSLVFGGDELGLEMNG